MICGQGPAPPAPPSRTTRASASISCPAPGCSPAACPARSRPGCCCCATTAPCRSPTCSSPRSTTPAKASRWSSARAPPSARSSNCSASTGRPRRRSICRAARCRRRARCSPTSSSPKPIRASCARPRAPAAIATSRSSMRARCGRTASSPRRSTASAAPRRSMDSSGERHRGVLTADDMARLAAAHRGAGHLSVRPLHRLQGRVLEPGSGDAAAACAAQGLRSRRRRSDQRGLHPHRWSSAPSSPIADRETFYGDPDFVKVPGDVLLSDAYNDARRKLIGKEASMEQRPGQHPGLRHAARHPRAGRQAPRRARRRRADGRRSQAWTHDDVVDPSLVAVGDGGKLERSGVMRGDTVHFDIIDRDGNMVSSTPSGGWLQSSPTIPELGFCLGTPRAAVLARRRPPERDRARQAPAHHADADHGVARRRAVSRLGLARRRPAGPVDRADVPAPRPLRHEPAGGDRRAGLALASTSRRRSGRARRGRACWWWKSRLPPETIKELRRRGHIVEVGPDWSEGRLTAASREGRRRKAAANPRGMQGYAAGRR